MSICRWNAIRKSDVERYDAWRVFRSYQTDDEGRTIALDIASPGLVHTRALAADVRTIWEEDESAQRFLHPLDFTSWQDDDWFDFGFPPPIPNVYTQFEEDDEGFLKVAHASTWAPPARSRPTEIDSSDMWSINPNARLEAGFDSSDRSDD